MRLSRHMNSFNHARRCLLSISAAACAMIATGTVAQTDDPAEWRDDRRPELREKWDQLEGNAPPPLDVLSDWTNAEKGTTWESLRGNVVLIDVWATWCGPCVAGIPHLVDLHKKYHDDGLVILGIHHQSGWEKMADFVNERELPYTFAVDREKKYSTALGIKFIPTYFVVDRSGIMRVAGVNREKMDEVVEALLAEPYNESMADGKSAGASMNSTQKSWPAHVKKQLYANDFRGKKAPKLVVEEWLTDKPELEGKVLMVDFWATWCGPCKKAIPDMNEWQKEFADDLVVVGLSDESASTVREFAKSTEFDYPLAIDTEGTTKRALSVKGIPHVMIVSTDGIVRWQGFPFSPEEKLTSEIIKNIIELDEGVAKRREAQTMKDKKTAGMMNQHEAHASNEDQ